MSHYDIDHTCKKCGVLIDCVRVGESGEAREKHLRKFYKLSEFCKKCAPKRKPISNKNKKG